MCRARKGVTLVEVMMVCFLVLILTVSVYQMLVPTFKRVRSERELVAMRTALDFVHSVLSADLRHSTNVTLNTVAGKRILVITLPSHQVHYTLDLTNQTLTRTDVSTGVNTVLIEMGVEDLSYRYTTLHEVTIAVRDITGELSTLKVMAAARR